MAQAGAGEPGGDPKLMAQSAGGTLPNVDDLLGTPSVDELLGAPPTPSSMANPSTGVTWDEYVKHAPLGRVLDAFGHGAAEGWGTANLGLSDKSSDALKKAGIFPDVEKGQGGIIRAFNEAIMRPAAAGVDAAMRAGGALFSGAQAATQAAFGEAGAPNLGRDIAAMPEAFFGQPGGLGVPSLPEARSLNVIGSGEGAYFGTAERRPLPENVTADAVHGLQEATANENKPGAVPSGYGPGALSPGGEPTTGGIGSYEPGRLPPADIHEAARQVAPGTFAEYDELTQKRENLRSQIAAGADELRQKAEAQAPHADRIAELQEKLQDTTPRLAKKYQAELDTLIPQRDAFLGDEFTMSALTRDTPEMQAMREELQRTDYRMRDLAPDVTAAYQKVAPQFPEAEQAGVAEAPQAAAEPAQAAAPEATPAPPVPQAAEPAAPTAEPASVPRETPPINIAEDVSRKLVEAGRPADEADAAGQVQEALWRTRAAAFDGKKGTAEEMYSREAPDIRAGRERAAAPERALELAQRGAEPQEEAPGRDLYQVAISKEPIGVDQRERNLSVVDILDPAHPALPPRSRGVQDIARDLMDRGSKALKALGVRSGRIEGPAPLTDELLSRTIAAEIKDALQRGGRTASDWYTHKIREAMAAISTVHPEIATDDNARMGFTSSLAVTSQGETVPSNVRLAEQAYSYFKENGRFPTNVVAKNGPAMNANFAKLNQLIEDHGLDGTRDFLSRDFTVKELTDAGFDIGGENMGTRVKGSVILGPKIGQGFYQNLNGNFNPVTMDLWFMRAWGRLTGTLVGMAPEAVAKQRARLEAALEAEGKKVPKTIPALLRAANQAISEHERDYTRNRAAYDSGEKTKSELTYASERFEKGQAGINEAPASGSQRNWMRDRIMRAKDLLAGEGINVTPADLQAIWWYPEKDLYGKLGGRDSEGINVDYASAIGDLAKRRGVSDEDLARAVGTVDQRSGPAGEANVSGGAEGGIEEGGGAAQADGRREGSAGADTEGAPRPDAGAARGPPEGRLGLRELPTTPESAAAFHKAISEAKAANPSGAAVALYSPQDYAGMRLFLADQGKAGFALKGDDIVSVFKHPDAGVRGAGKEMADMAVREGGRRLDAFDTVLPHIYSDAGFRAVARLSWDDEFAPGDWNHERMAEYNGGKPDVVFMVYDPDAPPYRAGDGQRVATYEEAERLQKDAVGQGAAPARELAQTTQGKIRLTEDGRSVITLFKNANASTFLHETGHDWLERMMRDAADPDAPAHMTADAATVRKYLGNDGGELTTKQHEKFARSFERYFMEGRAPSSALARVFEQFKNWLTQIYQTVSKLRAPITDDIRDVFDRLLTTHVDRQAVAPEPPAAAEPRPPVPPEAVRAVTSDLGDLHTTDAEHTSPAEAAEAADQIRAEREETIQKQVPDAADAIPDRGTGTEAGGGPAVGGEAGPTGPAAGGGPGGAPEPETVGAGGGQAAAKGADTSAKPTFSAEPFAGPEPRYLDKAGNIRLELLTDDVEARAALREMAVRNGDFMQARRGVVSDAEVIDLANSINASAKELNIQRLRQMSVEDDVPMAARVRAGRQMLLDAEASVRQAAAAGDPMAYIQAADRLNMIQETVSGITAEWGRAGRAFRDMTTDTAGAMDMAAMVRGATGKTLFQIKSEMDAISKMDTPAKIAKMSRDMAKPDFWDYAVEYFINNLISNPITHTTYAIGNETLTLWKALPETAGAAAIGSIRAAIQGSDIERVHWGEVGAGLYGFARGSKSGLIAAYQALKSGEPVKLPGEADVSLALQDRQHGAIPGVAGEAIRLPTRMVAAIHALARFQNYEMGISQRAYRTAMDEGHAGDAFNARVAELEQGPPPEMMAAARGDATQTALMGRGGEFSQAVVQLANSRLMGTKIPKLIIPFAQISSNIMEQGLLERTPLGFVDPEIRATLMGANGAVARDTQIARVGAGAALGGLSVWLAAQGNLTGSPPDNPKDAAAFRGMGKQPYSIRIGDTWYSYGRLGVIAKPVGLAADLWQLGGEIPHESVGAIASQIALSFSHLVLDESSMRGMGEALQAQSDPQRYGARWMRDMAVGFLPFTQAMGQLAKDIDPYQRNARSMLDAFKARIPGLSEGLPERIDVWGQPVPASSTLGGVGLTSIYTSRESNDPTIQKLAALQERGQAVWPAMPERKIRGVELTDAQYSEFATTAGRLTKMRLDALVGSPGFAALPDGVQASTIRDTITSSRETARTLTMMKNPEIVQKAIAAKRQQVSGQPKQ